MAAVLAQLFELVHARVKLDNVGYVLEEIVLEHLLNAALAEGASRSTMVTSSLDNCFDFIRDKVKSCCRKSTKK